MLSSIESVKWFEKLNPVPSVNVYGFDGIVYPLYLSEKDIDEKRHVNLLLYKGHFYCISDLATLVGMQSRVSRRKRYICDYCLSFFPSYHARKSALSSVFM